MRETLIEEIKKKWLHSGFQKYLRNTSWVFFAKFFSLGISFVTTIYVIRYLGPENYGVLAFSISFVGLFGFIAALGIDAVLYRELVKDLSRKDELLGTSLSLKVGASTLAIVLILISTIFIKNDYLAKILIAINSFSLLFASFTVIGYYFQARIEAKYQSISLILVTVVLNSLKLLVVFFDKGIIYFASVFLVENILYGLISIYFYTKKGNTILNFTFNKNTAISLLRDSWPLMLSSAFILVYTRIDQVMLKFMTTNFNVGVYDAAARISEIWYFIPSLIISSIFPAILNSKKVSIEFFEQRLTKLYSLVFYLAIIVALPISIYSNYIIKILYGNDFMQAAPVLSIYVWAGIPIFLTIAINTYLLAENKNKISFIGSFIGMTTNIILNLWLIPIHGIYGAAFATLISYSFIPLSILIFKDTRRQIILIKNGILYPFKVINSKLWI